MLHLLPLAYLAALAPLTSAQFTEAPTRPPNIVYILADDLGYGELGCYGQEKLRTPRIDRLAREGMRFTEHYSGSPVCAPARCVLMTGLHTGHALVRANWENGGWGEDEPEGQLPLEPGTTTLASVLHDAGYATAAIGKWGLGGPGTSGHPNDQGFDLFHGYLCQRKAHNYYPAHLWRNDEKQVLEGNGWFKAHQKLSEPFDVPGDYYELTTRAVYAPDRMLDEALRFVTLNHDRPFLLYFASPIPHAALQIPPDELAAWPAEWDEQPYLGQKGYLPHPRPRAAYAAMVARFDSDVGHLLDLLDELGLADDTIVMLSSDNGPTFNGGTDSAFFESTAGLRGLKGSVWEGGLRVPMIARWPGRIAAGAESDHPSGFQDVLPTVLELASIERELDGDGLSFAPTLLGTGEQPEHEALYWEYVGKQALRSGRWKAVRPRVGKGELEVQLYDLDSDPAESTDVAADHPELVARMEALLAAAHTPSAVFPIAALDGE